jgi:hypothetical protein
VTWPNAVFFKISILYDTKVRVITTRRILFEKPKLDEIVHRFAEIQVTLKPIAF